MFIFSEENKANRKEQKLKESLPWVEKYRPSSFDDIVGNDDIIKLLRNFSTKGNCPNMILSGSSGTGKTTSILCLVYEMLGRNIKDSVLELNASDDRGIEVVRVKIKEFARKKIDLPEGFHKIVILDEVDSMTTKAQQALRRIIEVYANSTRFALSCNISSKIIGPIQSRCSILRFNRLTDENIAERLEYVCKSENIEYTDEGIKSLIFTSDGDMRNAINNLESTYIGFGSITDTNVFKVCDQPHPNVIKDILEACFKADINLALKYLNILHPVL